MLVGLYGPSRAGKDTVAAVLVEKYGFEQRNFATPIRSALMNIFDLVAPQIAEDVRNHGWDYVKAKYPESVDAMIALGQDMRNISPDIWLNATIQVSYTDLVIPDVRQLNEADEIRARGGVIWKIERPSEQQNRGMDGLLDGKIRFDANIINDRTIGHLEDIVVEIMEAQFGARPVPVKDEDEDWLE